jgi:hypothetical protein
VSAVPHRYSCDIPRRNPAAPHPDQELAQERRGAKALHARGVARLTRLTDRPALRQPSPPGRRPRRGDQRLGFVYEAKGLSALRPARLVEDLAQASEDSPGLLALPEPVMGHG